MATQYQIQSGDTLSRIAQQRGTTVENLMSLNKQITDPNKIYAGQNLTISADTLQNNQGLVKLPETPQDNTNYSGTYSEVPNVNAGTNAMPDWMKIYLEAPGPSNPIGEGVQEQQQTALDTTSDDAIAKQQTLINTQSELNNYNAQLQGIANEVKQAELKLPSEGISAGAIRGRNISNEREAAIRALPLQSLALLAQGKVATAQGNVKLAQQLQQQAQKKLDRTFEIQLNYQEQLFNYNQKKRDAVLAYADKLQTQKLQTQQQEDQNKFTLLRDNLSYARDLATTAIENGQGALAAQIAGLDIKSDTYRDELAKLAGQIKPKVTTTTGTTIKSGRLVVPESAISQGQQVLDSVKGKDGYVYTPKYLEMLDAWKKDGGLEQDFFTNYPPKNYLNPNDASVPKYIRDKLKQVEEREL